MSSELVLRETSEAVTIDQQRIASKVEEVFERGLDTVLDLLEFGLAEHRLIIARSILTAATKLLGAEKDTRTHELRIALTDLFSQMATPDAPQLSPASPAANNPDEELGAGPP